MNPNQIAEMIVEEGYSMTNNIMEAIYILEDGQLISGDFDYGSRGTDHRMIECIAEGDRYDNDFWDRVHADLKVVRLVPETMVALITVDQKLTDIQEELVESAGYEIERY